MSFPIKSYSFRFSSLFSGSEIKIYLNPEIIQKADKTFDLTISQNHTEKSVSKSPNIINYPKKKKTTNSYSFRFSSLFSGSEIKIYPNPEIIQKTDKTFDLTISQNHTEKSVSKSPNPTNYPKKKTPIKSYSFRFSSLFSGSEIKIYLDPEVTQKADKTFDLTISQNHTEKSVSKSPNIINYPKKKKPTNRRSYHKKTSKLAKSDLKIQKRRRYTLEFKQKFVNYIINDGLTKRMAIKKFNVPYSTATQWIQLALQNSSGLIKIPKKISEPSTTRCKHFLN